MRGARLVTPNGDLVIMPKTWLQHSTFLTTAIEYGDDAIPHVPVPFEKGVLEDLAAWCQLLDCALGPYLRFCDDKEETTEQAASAAWSAFTEQHELRSTVPLAVVQGQPLSSDAGKDIGVVVQADVTSAYHGRPTIRSLLAGGGPGCLEPLFRLIRAADMLEVHSFLRVASTCLREYIADLEDPDEIRTRFGDEPDIGPEIFEEWLATLDERTLRTAQQAGPFWRAATQKLLPTPRVVPYHCDGGPSAVQRWSKLWRQSSAAWSRILR